MKKESNEKKLIIFLASLVIILWVVSWIFVDSYFSVNKDIYANRGAFGDKFGFINSLFSGLALAGIIYSIILQQKELVLQRKELSNTREEFKDQNFQTTFFNLLRTQREIINEIKVKFPLLGKDFKKYQKEVNGREFFYYSKLELKKILNAFESEEYSEFNIELISHVVDEINHHEGLTEEGEEKLLVFNNRVQHFYIFDKYNIDKKHHEHFKSSKTEETKIKMVYNRFLGKYGYAIGHYFRHLYHILLFLETSENERIARLNEEVLTIEIITNLIEKIKNEHYNYAQFIKSQMDVPELFLLFYNSIEFEKAKHLYIKFNLLDNLPIKNLLKPEHNIFPDFKLL